ncbi:MAG: hypothetical protein ACI35P_07525 [Bacillus sp. (in: firmicutes)]
MVQDGPSYNCDHNLLGTVGVEVVITSENVIDSEQITRTICYYGCPAEGILSGKIFIARASVFDNLDCVLTWHSGISNFIVNMSMQAMVSSKYHF